MNVRDYIQSVIRTVVPALWGTALAWLVSVGVLDNAAAEGPGKAAGGLLVTASIGVFYIVARWLETQPWVPPFVSGILLGTATPPEYLASLMGGTSSDRDGARNSGWPPNEER